jgi:DNA-binding IclR family transcriptional regulator
VLDLLEYLAAMPRGATFPQLCEDLGLPKSSAHALLGTLTERGWLYLHEPTRRYRIGIRAWQIGRSFGRLDALSELARPHLEALRDELNETVQLAVLDGIENVYVAKVDSDHPLRLVSRVGSRLPAYATGLGKVLLAGLDPADLAERLRGVEMTAFTDRTIASPDELQAALALARERGYAEDEGEYTAGVYCVAVPVGGADGNILAALSCSVPSARYDGTDEARAALLASLSTHAAALAAAAAVTGLSYRDLA